MKREIYADTAQARATDRPEEPERVATERWEWGPMTDGEVQSQRERIEQERKRSAAQVRKGLAAYAAFFRLD